MSNVCPNQRRELYTLHGISDIATLFEHWSKCVKGSVMVTDTNASAKRKFSETESDVLRLIPSIQTLISCVEV